MPLKTAYIAFCTPITDKSVQALTGVIADQLGKDIDHIYLMISTDGGTNAAGLHLYHFLKSLPIRLTTHACGELFGVGMLPYLAGDKRLAVPAARFLPLASSAFNYEKMDDEGLSAPLNQAFAETLMENSKISAADLADIASRQRWQDAPWARRKGIVQSIAALKLPAKAVLLQPAY